MKVRAWFNVMCLGRVPLSEKVENGLVVSLTSYGDRVTNNSVSYALYSLLTQRVRAEHTVLWLEQEKYADDTLPPMLRRLQKHGVEVRYCPNWRSYKKLLPTLMHYPGYDVVTADDDLYYSASHLEELIRAHRQHPHAVIVQGMRVPVTGADGLPSPYRQWKTFKHVPGSFEYNHYLAVPLGGYGAYYPSGIFVDDEVLNYNVISQLCPYADDLWFYVMGLRKHIRKEHVRNAKSAAYELDLVRQHFHRDRLYAINVGNDENDAQLNRILDHYHLHLSDFMSASARSECEANSKSSTTGSE